MLDLNALNSGKFNKFNKKSIIDDSKEVMKFLNSFDFITKISIIPEIYKDSDGQFINLMIKITVDEPYMILSKLTNSEEFKEISQELCMILWGDYSFFINGEKYIN